MHGEFALFATITMAVLAAFLFGFLARKLRLPTLVGYLVAGLVISPFTPGFVGDVDAASQLAEIGVVFMMFGVGLHFSLKDLWSVRAVAIPGAILQTALSTLAGLALSQLWGWSLGAGLVLGLSLSVASTVVLLRGLTDRGLVSTPHGRVAIGWLPAASAGRPGRGAAVPRARPGHLGARPRPGAPRHGGEPQQPGRAAASAGRPGRGAAVPRARPGH